MERGRIEGLDSSIRNIFFIIMKGFLSRKRVWLIWEIFGEKSQDLNYLI